MTLSVILEFNTIVLSFKYATDPSRLCQQAYLIADIISESGIAATLKKPVLFRPHKWFLIFGYTLRATAAEGVALCERYPYNFAINLMSPIFYDALDGAAWKDNVSLVLSAVSEQLNWKPNPYVGFHVYFRLGANERFTLPELKRIAMMVCRFEGVCVRAFLPPIVDVKISWKIFL